MTKYKPGDKVTLEHEDGSKLVDRAIHTDGRGAYPAALVLESFWDLDNLPEGWRVTKHNPKHEPLPTEPGAYADCHGAYWLLGHAGDWYSMHDLKNWKAEVVSRFAPLTRLVPAGSEAREVLNWIRDSEWSSGVKLAHIIAASRKHFGVNA